MASRLPAGQLVVKTSKHDVLFGRGKRTNRFTGNVYFRQLVADRAVRYVSMERGSSKLALATEIMDHVHAQQGRFLRSVTARNAKGERIAAWEVVEGDVVLVKVKQAMRDAALLQRRKTIQNGNAGAVLDEDVEANFASTTRIRGHRTTLQQHSVLDARTTSTSQSSLLPSLPPYGEHSFAAPSFSLQSALLQGCGGVAAASPGRMRDQGPLVQAMAVQRATLAVAALRGRSVAASRTTAYSNQYFAESTSIGSILPPFARGLHAGSPPSSFSHELSLAPVHRQERDQRLLTASTLPQQQPQPHQLPMNQIDRLLAELPDPAYAASSATRKLYKGKHSSNPKSNNKRSRETACSTSGSSNNSGVEEEEKRSSSKLARSSVQENQDACQPSSQEEHKPQRGGFC